MLNESNKLFMNQLILAIYYNCMTSIGWNHVFSQKTIYNLAQLFSSLKKTPKGGGIWSISNGGTVSLVS